MSSVEHKKYIREQKSKQDALQSRLNNQGNLVKPTEKVKEEKLNIDKIVYCPFCLYRAKLAKFLMTDVKGGISTYRAKCPECKVTMLMKTVNGMHYMTDAKIEQYAQWVCDYRYGFWKKCNKKIWDKRLKSYGWVGIFWKKYKAIKATFMRPDNEYEAEQEYEKNRQDYIKEREERYKRGEE